MNAAVDGTINARGATTYALEIPTERKPVRYSTIPTPTYKWAVVAVKFGAFAAHAWAKTRRQAVGYATAHGLQRETYAVARLARFDGRVV